MSGSVVSGTTSGSAVSGETGKEIRIILKAEDIKPGKTVRAERTGSNGNEDQFQLENEQLVKIELYAGKALYVYHVDTETYNFKWGTKDKKAPVISGFVKGKSATGYGDIYRVYYADMKKQYHYTQFVKARDNRDGPVKVKADTSGINWKKEGVYKLRFSATDRSGNTAKSWAKVRVYLPGSAESAADQILRSITRKSWSQEKKARAIYRYIRGHSSYIPHSAHGNWRQAGLRGLRYRSGDCYSFYATARLLLTRAGITNVMVKRYPVPNGMTHYWNLAYIRGGWYHFDTTPRSRNANFCLWTDAQLWNYSTGYVFQFKRKAFPKRATKRL